MNIIKLDATASTNTYLRDLLYAFQLENFTVVVAENQFAGKGQRGAEWLVESGSNLTFSILLKDLLLSPESVFDLNIVVGISVLNGLKKKYKLPFSIKWPNDILAGNKKICGILIENIIKSSGEVLSIAGVGINVNQQNFENLPQGTSLFNLLGTKIDKEEVMEEVLNELKQNFERLKSGDKNQLWNEYHKNLFKYQEICVFELPNKHTFEGVIQGVTRHGNLTVTKENGVIEEFAIKEIKMLY